MAFRLAQTSKDDITFAVNTGDGDFNISANGVDIAYIEKQTGKLVLFGIDEDEREKLPGLSISNGKLTVV